MSKNFLIAAQLVILVSLTSMVNAEQDSAGLQFVPHNYSPYQAERSEMSQSREELVTPYSSAPPVVETPRAKRPYAVLPPSTSGYGYYDNRQYSQGGYPYYGNAPGGGSWGSPWGSGPGFWGGGMPWGGGPWGGSPWGGSPWGNSFSWFGGPGAFPFGW